MHDARGVSIREEFGDRKVVWADSDELFWNFVLFQVCYIKAPSFSRSFDVETRTHDVC